MNDNLNDVNHLKQTNNCLNCKALQRMCIMCNYINNMHKYIKSIELINS